MIKVYVSYFYQIRFFSRNTIPLSTAVWDPKWYHSWNDQDYTFYDKNLVINGLRVPMLAPGDSCKNLCQGTSKCTVRTPSSCDFMEAYKEQLSKIDFNNFMTALEMVGNSRKLIDKFDGDPIIVLIVHEAPDNPCSERTALQQWFRDNGYELKEWTPEASVRVGIQSSVPRQTNMRCPDCGGELEVVWYTEYEERVKYGIRTLTGRTRLNANYLECTECMKKQSVDDETFAHPWKDK